MPRVRAVGPVALTYVLILAFASGCGESEGQSSSSTSTTTTESQCPEVPVVVAVQDIPAGTTGAEAAANGLLREEAIPDTFRPATAITSLDQVTDAVTVADLGANEVVTFDHFGLPTDTRLAPSVPICGTAGPTTTAGG